MNRQEFIDGMRASLSGRVPSARVEENINYYQDYINMEMRKGRTEDDVLQSLGDPRLIARTIVETSGQEIGSYEEPEQENAYERTRKQYEGLRRVLRLPGWMAPVVVILVVALLGSLIFSVLSFLSPLILVFGAVLIVLKLFRDWLN